MEASITNGEIVKKIINILGENNCTVARSKQILRFTSNKIDEFATVQKVNGKLFEVKDH